MSSILVKANVINGIMEKMTEKLGRWKGGYAALFLPSIFFIAVGIFTLFAPHLVVAALATFFFFLGAFTCYVAWKLVQLRRKMEALVKNFEARIYIQKPVQAQVFEEFEAVSELQAEQSQKKIVVH